MAILFCGYSIDKLGQYQEAIPKYEQAIELNPSNASAYYNLACNYPLLNNAKESAKYLQLAIEKQPNIKDYLTMAKTDSDFNAIRHSLEFQKVINKKE